MALTFTSITDRVFASFWFSLDILKHNHFPVSVKQGTWAF